VTGGGAGGLVKGSRGQVGRSEIIKGNRIAVEYGVDLLKSQGEAAIDEKDSCGFERDDFEKRFVR
jgi:hypothetical protein